MQAVRFGQAAAFHLAAGRSENELFAALEALPDGPVLQYALCVDSALEACGLGKPGLLEQVTRDTLLDSYVDVLPFAVHIQNDRGRSYLKVDFAVPCPPRSARRIDGCVGLIAHMENFAARTYVPETDQSRITGAGAGLTDND